MSELQFWLIAGAMLVSCVFFFVTPLLSKKGQAQSEKTSRDELNTAFYHDRMAEISNETKEGLIENPDDLVVELKQSLLDDIPDTTYTTNNSNQSLAYCLSGCLLFVAVVLGIYWFVGNQDKVVAWHETAKRLPQLSSRMMEDAQNPMTDEEMADLTLALRTQLRKTPEDGIGWLLLGRIALANRDIQTAEGAMKKAFRLMPEDKDVQLGYAQSLMLTGDDTNKGIARNLLKNLIKEDNTNLQAMSLLAFEAFERGAYLEAKAAWQTMKDALPKDDPRHSMLDRSIAQVDKRTQAPKGQSITVNIALSPDLTLPEQGVLFVSVHSADGAPMPIAAKRLPLSGFPKKVVITDADSMIPERPMSSLTDVMIKARIDVDGNVMTKEGNWQGVSPSLKLGEETRLTIKED